MEAYGVKPNRRTYALQIEACLKDQELEVRIISCYALMPPTFKTQQQDTRAFHDEARPACSGRAPDYTSSKARAVTAL
jgi:hypothetical protein